MRRETRGRGEAETRDWGLGTGDISTCSHAPAWEHPGVNLFPRSCVGHPGIYLFPRSRVGTSVWNTALGSAPSRKKRRVNGNPFTRRRDVFSADMAADLLHRVRTAEPGHERIDVLFQQRDPDPEK